MLERLYTGFRSNVPQLFADIDREKVKRLGIALQDVFDTLQAYLGSAYVNDFNKFGRTFKVYTQADARSSAPAPEDIAQLRVRAASGKMVPLGTLTDVRRTFGPPTVTRYNVYPAISIKGSPAPGYSSGQAIAVMEDMAKADLPDTMGYEWTGTALQEKKRRRAGADHLRPRDRVRVPDPRRPVRVVVDPVLRHSRDPDRASSARSSSRSRAATRTTSTPRSASS